MKFELALLLIISLVFVIPIIGAVYLKVIEDRGTRYKKRQDKNPYLEYLHNKNKRRDEKQNKHKDEKQNKHKDDYEGEYLENIK